MENYWKNRIYLRLPYLKTADWDIWYITRTFSTKIQAIIIGTTCCSECVIKFNYLLTMLCRWLNGQGIIFYIRNITSKWNGYTQKQILHRVSLGDTWRPVKTHKSVLFLLRPINALVRFTKNASRRFYSVIDEHTETHGSVFFLLR